MSAQQPSGYQKSLPEITPLTKPFWDATKRHELVIQRCAKCEGYQWYPRAICTLCGSRDLKWAKASGKGSIYSFVVIRQVIDNSPAFQSDIPFVLAEVELEEGPRMYAPMVGCKPEDVRIGMKVEVLFEDATDTVAIPKFKLVP